MRSASIVIVAILIPLLLFCARGKEYATDDLEAVNPEDVGWSSEKLRELGEAAGRAGYSAVILLHDGKVMYEWGEVEMNYWCHSIRKPFLSALYGIYVDKGVINLDATMEELGIDDIPPRLTRTEKTATVRHLLQGRSGIYHEAAGENQQMRDRRPERYSHEPGTFFYYNNWDFNALGTIFEDVTGKKIFDEFEKRIAAPIGMQDFDPSECKYNLEADKSRHPKYSFRISARDIARFGALYQRNGVWNGKRIIPESWMTESTTAYSEKDGGGFGYMWGIAAEGSWLAELVGGRAIFFSGAGVHNLVVLPDSKIVFVLRMDTDGDWSLPDREDNARIYALLREARVG
jgi:CubicO group peptidase (beta-lactamase class C family)